MLIVPRYRRRPPRYDIITRARANRDIIDHPLDIFFTFSLIKSSPDEHE